MTARRLLALLALLGVLWLATLARERTSPGPVSVVHAREGLSGADACLSCHADASTGLDMAGACTTCHTRVEQSLLAARGVHGGLDPEVATDCARCHGEHHGSGFELVNSSTFERAGFASRDAYDHPALDFELHGVHAALECARCHEHADTQPLPAGVQRFLGLDPTCTACHSDPHEGDYGNSCATCHGQARPFPEMDGFEHQAFCPLVGAHAEVECATCHVPDSDWSVAQLVARPAGLTGDERDCASCHVSPHREAFLLGTLDPGSTRGASCASCHSAEQHDFRGEQFGSDAWHAASGFTLDAPHDALTCTECHPGLGTREPLASTFVGGVPQSDALDLSRFLADFPGREPDSCMECHGDPHLAQFDSGPFAESRCVDCHERHAFAPSRFDETFHARTEFALEGAHAEAECAACHEPLHASTPAARAARDFGAVDSACQSCHATPHAGNFLAAVAAELALSASTETCASCHSAAHVEGFVGDPADSTRGFHALTGFELSAPHDALECAACHAGFGEAKFDARLPDDAWHAAFPGRDASSCAACHDDPHAGQFVDSVASDGSCLSCHDAQHFAPSAFGEALHARSRFPLDGAHSAVACGACHRKAGEALFGGVTQQRPMGFAPAVTSGTARQFVGVSTRCGDCHEDVHDGRFDAEGLPASVAGARSCARCHGNESFTEILPERFEHERWTGYALEGAHVGLECRACHQPRAVPEFDGRRFGRAPGTQCSACHAVGGLASEIPTGSGR